MKKVLSLLLVAAMACTTLVFAGCQSEAVPTGSTAASSKANESKASPSSAAANLTGTLTLNGSTSMTKVCDAMGEAFMAKYTGVKVEKQNTGSGAAVEAVNGGTALIGDLSRKLKDEEKPDSFSKVTIALDGIAIIVNKNSKVADLTSEQIAKIFTGEITNWSQVGGADSKITVIGREEGSGTRDGFESIFKVEKGVCKYDANLSETGQVVARVGSDATAVGYVSLASVSGDVKAVKVDGVEATEANVANATYKAQRPFVEIYTKGSDSDLVKAWFAFIASEDGQKVIKDQGLVPVTIKAE